MDSNIVMYLINGDKDIAEIINGKQIYVSFITQLELLGYSGLQSEERENVIAFLSDHNTHIIDINESIKQMVIDLRQKYRVKLPDAIIMGTSVFLDIPLLTADKDFAQIKEVQLLLYQP